MHNGKYGVRLGASPEWLDETKTLEEYTNIKSETVLYQIQKQSLTVSFHSKVFEMFVGNQEIVSTLINEVLDLSLENDKNFENYTLYNSMGEKYQYSENIWKILKEATSSRDTLFLKNNGSLIQVECNLYPGVSIYFEVDAGASLRSYIPKFCRKFGLEPECVRVFDSMTGIGSTNVNVVLCEDFSIKTLGITDVNPLLLLCTPSDLVGTQLSVSKQENVDHAPDINQQFKLSDLDALIQKLTEAVPDGSVEYLDFLKTFLLTYQSFTDANNLLEHLKKRYDVINHQKLDWKSFIDNRKPIQLRVCNVLLQWVKKYPYDFLRADGGEYLINSLLDYIDTVLSEENLSLAKQLRKNVIKLVDHINDSETTNPALRKGRLFYLYKI
jgi:hypothetical protein